MHTRFLYPNDSQMRATWLTKKGNFNPREEIRSREELGRKICGKKLQFFFLLVYSTHKKTAQRGWFRWECLQHTSTSCFIIIIWAIFFSPLFGRTRSRGRCWEANRLSHHPDQAVQSMRESMDWALEDNVVNSLIFCTTLASCGSDHTAFVQARAEKSYTGAETVNPKPRCQWHSQVFCSEGSITWCTFDCSLRLFPNNWKLV